MATRQPLSRITQESLESRNQRANTFHDNSSTKGWLDSVASNGMFTKAASMNDWTEGEEGIPSGWTVVDAQ